MVAKCVLQAQGKGVRAKLIPSALPAFLEGEPKKTQGCDVHVDKVTWPTCVEVSTLGGVAHLMNATGSGSRG